MGSGTFTTKVYDTYATTSGIGTKTRAEIFSRGAIDPGLDPKGVVRESRDSVDNPNSTPVILALDVTGSMGFIPEIMVKKGIPTLMENIFAKKPITDPHIMCMGIGDELFDRAPLQVSQFEADIRIVQQLEKMYLEAGGGGNQYESYALAWYFAAHQCHTDSWDKRKKKGYIFTIGDELPTPKLTASGLKEFLGAGAQADASAEDILTEVSKRWEIFHVVVAEGSNARGNPKRIVDAWNEVIGQRTLLLNDHTKLGEVVVSALQVAEGVSHDTVVKGWDGSTALVVKDAIKDLTPSDSSGIVIL